MTSRRKRIEMLSICAARVICLALVGALAATPALAAWVHPSVSGGSRSTAPRVVVVPAPSQPLNASASNRHLTGQATGSAVSVGSTTTTTSINVQANGSSETTTKTVTTYASATSIVVTVSLTALLGSPARATGPTQTRTFDFSNLSAGPQTATVFEGGYTITATPNLAGNDVGITYGFTRTNPSQYTMTLNLPPPPPTTVSTSTAPSAPSVSNQSPPPYVPTPTATLEPDDVVAQVLALSQESQTTIEACNTNTPPCIADALDAYADKLEALTPRLPARLSALPTIVREAARKVRAARTKAEAVSAVKSAITQVNKTIALLRAEDPNAIKTGAAVGRAVDQTLEVAEVKLLRSSGL
jgi:hypothetical protein